MPQYLFKIEVGNFNEPSTDPWGSTDQSIIFELNVDAENLSQANKEIEKRFGDYTRCQYTYIGE